MRKWHLLLRLDSASPTATYQQVVDGLIEAIRNGRLESGAALPGTRELAQILDVNRKTVVQAYEEAISKGWLVSEPRRGTFVNARIEHIERSGSPKQPARSHSLFKPAFLCPELPAYFTQVKPVAGITRPDLMLAFDNGAPDHRLLPQTVLHRYYRNAMRTAFKANWTRYGSTESRNRLREALADMLRHVRGLPVTPEHICITQGTQMALRMAATAVLRPGDLVVVERLSYPPAWATFRALGAEVVTVEVDHDGCRVEEIEALCQERKVRMVYVTPHHQFPTTVSMKADRRQKLLLLAERYDFIVIEEDYDHEYHFVGRPYLPLASDTRQRHVIYIGSLSKLLAPSFRCGFIVAPPNLTSALRRIALLTSHQGDAVMEKMLADLLQEGELKRHLRRVGRIYKSRRDTLWECLHAAFRNRISIRQPEGGLALWTHFDVETPVDSLAERSLALGLQVRSGRQFSPDNHLENSLRLGFASMDHEEIAEAVRRLTTAANQLRHV